MPLMPRLRRAPWLAGALLLVLAASLVAPLAFLLGARRWSSYAGLAAMLLLLFGAIERLWQRASFPRRQRPVDRSRFRVVTGGKAKGKGNGHASDVPEDREGKGGGDKPRWVM